MYPSHQYPSWPPPGPVYNYPSPTPRASYRNWFIGVGVVFVAVIGFVIVLAAVLASGPEYSAAEQHFLTQVHETTSDNGQRYVWPGDQELVGEGHAICSLLSDGRSKTALEEPSTIWHGADPMPEFMKSYQLMQRHELIIASTQNFCDQYTTYFLGVPI